MYGKLWVQHGRVWLTWYIGAHLNLLWIFKVMSCKHFLFAVTCLQGAESHYADKLFKNMSPTDPTFINTLVLRSEVSIISYHSKRRQLKHASYIYKLAWTNISNWLNIACNKIYKNISRKLVFEQQDSIIQS